MFTRAWFKDTAERALSTFVQAFLVVLVAAGTDYLSVPTIKAAAISAGAAVLAVIKAAIATRTDSDVSPASLAR